jgi:hypothetical protein
MNFRVYTGSEEQILKIGVRTLTQKPEKIRLIVSDAEQNNTVFTSRYNVFNGDRFFYVRLPLAPVVALVQVYNEQIGNRPQKEETTFQMINEAGKPDTTNNGIYKMPLEKKMSVVDMGNPELKSFITFAQKFCYNAGILDTGKYQSSDGRITIEYSPTIFNKKDGVESSTPARIAEKTKIIEVSQKIIVPFTVPMRFAILCHEFSHCFLNLNKASEIEADLEGLLIYLGLGYPRFEAYQAFLETFIGTPTELNKKRYNIVNRFITDFEKNKFLIHE